MLDNRYEADVDSFGGTGDYLGEEQWAWLDSALGRSKEHGVTMTVIGAGIQMLVERLGIKAIENFRWKNKERLLEALARNKMENVVLISGDIHLG